MFSIKIYVDMLCDKVKRYEGVLFLPDIKRQAEKNYNKFWAQRFTTQISIIENNGITNKRSYLCPLPRSAVAMVWVRCGHPGSAFTFLRQGLMVIAELSCLLLCFETQTYNVPGLFELRLL